MNTGVDDYSPVYNITDDILNMVYDITNELAKITNLKEILLSPKLRKENRIRNIHSTLWIEGNTLSIDQVTAIFNGKQIIGPEKDILEVKNAQIAYDELFHCDPYSENDLLSQHKILMNGLIDNAVYI